MPTIQGEFGPIEYKDLTKEFPMSGSVRPELYQLQRTLSCAWPDFVEFAKALRGTCKMPDGTDRIFRRTTPHNFNLQNLILPLVCREVSKFNPTAWMTYDQAVAEGYPTITPAPKGGDPYPFTNEDDSNLAPYTRTHCTAEYSNVRWPLLEDDMIADPTRTGQQGGSGGGAPLGNDSLYEEWERYCEWSIEQAIEIITAPIGTYYYADIPYSNNQPIPVNAYLQFPSHSATITCKVYGLPIIPAAAFQYVGTVNAYDITFPLDPFGSTRFTALSETLLLQPPISEPVVNPDLSPAFNMTYRWIYRPQGHNAFFYLDTGTRRFRFERIAADVSAPQGDGSAPFSLRHHGYLWSPITP